jgi:hypothetical protein
MVSLRLKGEPLMDTERRSRLKILNRGRRPQERNHNFSSQPTNDRWKEWADDVWSEIARVHVLVDKVNAEVSCMLSDDSMHALQVLEKNAELRVLQAYYKGLRFAVDRQKEIAGRQLVGFPKME